jgi:hypothetical protein
MISKVALTGADDATHPADLMQICAQYPQVEWAILYGRPRMGLPRYPTASVIAEMARTLPKANSALHLCYEDALNDFYEQKEELMALARQFGRVQLNFFAKLQQIDAPKLNAAIMAFGQPVIVPYNLDNMAVLAQLDAPNIQYLFDRSGGKGALPAQWPVAVAKRLCGYAGGLGPDNLAMQLPLIVQAAQQGGAQQVWIDMESSLRDGQDRFCLTKCTHVLQQVYGGT